MASRVLAVDDDPQIVKLTVRFLNHFGFEARGLDDPREAADLIRSFSPEVCILDINMPFVSGSDLLDSIKSIDTHIEVILLTGLNDTVLAVDLMKRGAADFLLKPIDPKQMEVAVSRALEHRRLVLENTAYRLHLEMLVEERSKALNSTMRQLRLWQWLSTFAIRERAGIRAALLR
jgi:DNA-binding NtrC family response regulator